MAEPGERRPLLVRITDALRIPRPVVPHIRRFGWGGTLVLAICVLMVFGISPITIITGTYDPPREWTSRDNVPAAQASPEDLERYMDAVYREAQRGWVNMFLTNGISYHVPEIEYLSGTETGPCNIMHLPHGPHYCEDENTLVVDLEAYDRLARAHGENGHLAQAYLLARAYGVQVQSTLQSLRVNVTQREALTQRQRPVFVRQLALQPHCLAGMWAAWAAQPNFTENPRIVSLVGQAEAMRENGLPFDQRPSVAEQAAWFTSGYDLPIPRECDPFNNLPGPDATVAVGPLQSVQEGA